MPTQTSAVIDIGTNSIKLLVAEVTSAGIIKPILEQVVITRLGRGLDKSNRLHPAGIKKTLTVIKKFLKRAHQKSRGKIDDIDLLATSAVREAHNAASFIRLVCQETGLGIKVLSPKEESRLAYFGAMAGTEPRRHQNNLVLDIGGGSTELSFISERGRFCSRQLPLGAVKLTERFIHSDPVSQADYRALVTFIRRHLSPALTPTRMLSGRGKGEVIGIGGTITTLAALDPSLSRLPPPKIHGHIMRLTTLDSLLDYFIATTLKEKQKIDGLEPGRADIILAGTAILINLMKVCNARAITTSTSGLRHGWLIKMTYRSRRYKKTPAGGGRGFP